MRASSMGLHVLLEQVLAAHLVDDPQAPSNYSVQLVADGAPGKAFHFLYDRSISALRTRSPRRLVEGLLSYLNSHTAAARDDLLVVDALAFVGDGRALLVPHAVRLSLSKLERPLNRAGFALVDVPRATLDVVSGQLVVPEWDLAVDAAALDGLEALGPGRREPVVPPGRYPLAGWAFGGPDGEGMSPATAVWQAATLVRGAPGAQRTLDCLQAVFAHT
ncbi:MAG: hypothetical protein M3N52_07745, partial [Actinomycetota bacterium]|nr:hypothetical protein [Actinomycetota bacterium]